MRLAIHFMHLPNGYCRASCPALPGCTVYGETREQARARIQDAISGYLASLDVALPRELGRSFQSPDVREVA